MNKILIAILDDEDICYDLLEWIEKKEKVQEVYRSSTGSLRYGSLEINPKYRTVKQNGIHIKLTNYEFNIFYLLASHPGQVFTKRQIFEQVWNLSYVGAEDNVVSLIHRLRKKVEPDPSVPQYIITVWGIGYKFCHTGNE